MKQNYIAGEWIDGPRTTDDVNPSDTTDVIGQYAHADAEQLGQASAAAAAAVSNWAHSGPQQRADVLDRIGSEVLARREELGTLLAREEGKTLAEGIGEASRAGNIFKFFAQEALRLAGDKLASVRPGVEIECDPRFAAVAHHGQSLVEQLRRRLAVVARPGGAVVFAEQRALRQHGVVHLQRQAEVQHLVDE